MEGGRGAKLETLTRSGTCEFLQRFLNPNSSAAIEPPHACEFCDIAMAPPGDKVKGELEEQ